MGLNLVVLRNFSGSLGSYGSPRRPPGSFGHPECRSAPPRGDLFLITRKHRNRSAKMHKTAQIRYE